MSNVYREQGRKPEVCPTCGWGPGGGAPVKININSAMELLHRLVRVDLIFRCPCGASQFTDSQTSITSIVPDSDPAPAPVPDPVKVSEEDRPYGPEQEASDSPAPSLVPPLPPFILSPDPTPLPLREGDDEWPYGPGRPDPMDE